MRALVFAATLVACTLGLAHAYRPQLHVNSTNEGCPGRPSFSNVVLCYYEGRAPAAEIDPCLCSHLVLTHAARFPDGSSRTPISSLTLHPGLAAAANYLRKRNPDLRVLGRVNGGARAALTTTRGAEIASALARMTRDSGLDGLEVALNWEGARVGGGAHGKQRLVSLVKGIRAALVSTAGTRGGRYRRSYSVREEVEDVPRPAWNSRYYIRSNGSVGVQSTSASPERSPNKPVEQVQNEPLLLLEVSAKPGVLGKRFDLKPLAKYVDYFTVPTQYISDESEFGLTYHHSRLMGLSDILNTDSVLDLLTGLGAPAPRLIMTLPTVALRFQLDDPALNKPRSPASSAVPVPVSHQQVCQLLQEGGWMVERDEDLTAPYAFKNDSWIAFDDELSVEIKGKYALLRGLAGVGVWAIDYDDLANVCGRGRSGLTRALASTMTSLARRPRSAVLQSLVEPIAAANNQPLLVSSRSGRQIGLSPYRVVRIVDRAGAVQVIRRGARTQFECSRQGYYSHPQGCDRFYRCVKFDQRSDEYSVFEYDCPAGLAFDEKWEVCMWPGQARASCAGSSEIRPVPRNKFVCSSPGYYADPENCRWFYACMDHRRDGAVLTPYEFRCPYGLGFDEQNSMCNWPWLVPNCAGAYSGSASIHSGAVGVGPIPSLPLPPRNRGPVGISPPLPIIGVSPPVTQVTAADRFFSTFTPRPHVTPAFSAAHPHIVNEQLRPVHASPLLNVHPQFDPSVPIFVDNSAGYVRHRPAFGITYPTKVPLAFIPTGPHYNIVKNHHHAPEVRYPSHFPDYDVGYGYDAPTGPQLHTFGIHYPTTTQTESPYYDYKSSTEEATTSTTTTTAAPEIQSVTVTQTTFSEQNQNSQDETTTRPSSQSGGVTKTETIITQQQFVTQNTETQSETTTTTEAPIITERPSVIFSNIVRNRDRIFELERELQRERDQLQFGVRLPQNRPGVTTTTSTSQQSSTSSFNSRNPRPPSVTILNPNDQISSVVSIQTTQTSSDNRGTTPATGFSARPTVGGRPSVSDITLTARPVFPEDDQVTPAVPTAADEDVTSLLNSILNNLNTNANRVSASSGGGFNSFSSQQSSLSQSSNSQSSGGSSGSSSGGSSTGTRLSVPRLPARPAQTIADLIRDDDDRLSSTFVRDDNSQGNVITAFNNFPGPPTPRIPSRQIFEQLDRINDVAQAQQQNQFNNPPSTQGSFINNQNNQGFQDNINIPFNNNGQFSAQPNPTNFNNNNNNQFQSGQNNQQFNSNANIFDANAFNQQFSQGGLRTSTESNFRNNPLVTTPFRGFPSSTTPSNSDSDDGGVANIADLDSDFSVRESTTTPSSRRLPSNDFARSDNSNFNQRNNADFNQRNNDNFNNQRNNDNFNNQRNSQSFDQSASATFDDLRNNPDFGQQSSPVFGQRTTDQSSESTTIDQTDIQSTNIDQTDNQNYDVDRTDSQNVNVGQTYSQNVKSDQTDSQTANIDQTDSQNANIDQTDSQSANLGQLSDNIGQIVTNFGRVNTAAFGQGNRGDFNERNNANQAYVNRQRTLNSETNSRGSQRNSASQRNDFDQSINFDQRRVVDSSAELSTQNIIFASTTDRNTAGRGSVRYTAVEADIADSQSSSSIHTDSSIQVNAASGPRISIISRPVAANALPLVEKLEGAAGVGLGRKFDRYGPGGWRSANETLGPDACTREGLFRHPHDCNKFYECFYDSWKDRYTLHVFNCPIRLSYDPTISACNWPVDGPGCSGNRLLLHP